MKSQQLQIQIQVAGMASVRVCVFLATRKAIANTALMVLHHVLFIVYSISTVVSEVDCIEVVSFEYLVI